MSTLYRIVYDNFYMFVQPLEANTIVTSDDQHVFFSYMANGQVEVVDGPAELIGMLYSEGNTIDIDANIKTKPRKLAVHQSGVVNCLYNRNETIPNVQVEVVQDSTVVQPNTQVLILKGSFTVDSVTAMQYDLIDIRPEPITILGNGTIAKLT